MRVLITDIVILGLVLAMIAGIAAALSPNGIAGTATQNLIASVTYSCDSGKTIHARFYKGPSQPPAGPGQPPTPGGSVALSLSDGRTMTLPQTISADGGRYANTDESFVFWSKGKGAFVTENGTTTYANCTQE